ncbi:MAG: GGDEF domain-containing protein [Treponema sp.]|nr:GGDEF domain-containing protein [Treponema sp.]
MERYQYSKSELEILENSEIPFAIYQFVDKHVVTLALSSGFLELFDFDDRKFAYDLMDNNMYRDSHPDDIAELHDAAIDFALDDIPYNIIYRSKVKNSYRLIHAFGKHFYKDGNKLAIIWYTDEGPYIEADSKEKSLISTIYSNLYRAKHISQYDYLTGLPAISYFFSLVETNFIPKSLKNKKVPAMLFFDFNGIKYFNAKYGFAEGDNLIRAFSKLLISYFTDKQCCRFGMDTFCVYTDEENIEEILFEIFKENESINNGKSITVRAGIYSSVIELCNVSTACDRAKMACDFNKSSNISHFTYFDNSMLEDSLNKQYIIENIDKAIKEGWIKIYYQPIVRAANGRVCDEEALSRWDDPVKGFMNPNDFISILEDENLIYKLDLYVTEQVLIKMKQQADKGLYIVPISVNLSRSDFTSCDIVSEIEERVDKAGIPHEKLTIEITESIIGRDFDYMKLQIKRFQNLGFKVWMDDFGSGYSSLDVLHDISFDLIKFDMRFMNQFYENEKSKIILTGLMKTASSLGIDTICEGVETEDQVDFLKEIGCTKLQGYYYTPPLPSEKVFERYDKGTQIGFENPAETEYYSSLGKINLYDLSIVTNQEDMIYENFFSTPPMAILEINGKNHKLLLGNKTFREFLRKYLKPLKNNIIDFDNQFVASQNLFSENIEKCIKSKEAILIDEKLNDGSDIHVYIRPVAENPVTKVNAIVIVILGIK